MNSDQSASNDQALLQSFARQRDENAFRTLVEQYTGLVYGVALRRTRQSQVAEEIAQNVFLALARKAPSLSKQLSLGAWLHRAATLESLRYLRQEKNRHRHLAMISDFQEQEATGKHSAWHEIRPFLDELLNRLSAHERSILIQHYLEGYTFQEIAQKIGLPLAATQKKSTRALEKLSRLLKQRGVVASGAILASGLGTELAHGAPAGLAGKIGGSVLASSVSTSTITTSTFLTVMTTSKLTFAATFVLAALIPITLTVARPQSSSQKPSVTTSSSSSNQSHAEKTTRSTFDAEVFRHSLQKFIESDPLDQEHYRRLQRLIFTLSAEEIQEVLAVLDEFKNDNRLYDIVGATFARWTELDPESAVADANARPKDYWGSHPLFTVLMTWAFSDWSATLSWAATHENSFHFGAYLSWQARTDGPLAIARAKELAKHFPSRGDHYMKVSLHTWARHDPQKAITWMDEHFTDPVKRDKIIGSVLEMLGEHSPGTALEHIPLISNPERIREARYNIVWTWTLLQPSEAIDHFQKSGGGESWNPNTIRSIAEAFSRNDPARAIEVARTIEDEERRDHFYCGILCGATQSDLSLVVEAAEAISEKRARTNNSLGRFLEDWASRDRQAAHAWVEALPEGKKKQWARHMFPQD